MSWTRGIHLIHWADTQEARTTLPRLIRRLIRSTVPTLTVLNFPADEQVQRPGFDGHVETTQGNEFVPSGASSWEMGVDKDPKGKADKDFQKRTENVSVEEQCRSTFVFVTPRVWQKKDEWAEEMRSKSEWQDIIVHDANDLEHWLEIAPAVDVWFTRLTGRFSQGVQDLQSYWNAVRSLAEFPLNPSVFTASRDVEIATIYNWLSQPPGSFFLSTHGLTEGLDFLAALGASDNNEKLENGVIIYTSEAWRHIAASRESLLLIAGPALELATSDTAGAVAAGHHVFVSAPLGSDSTSRCGPPTPRLLFNQRGASRMWVLRKSCKDFRASMLWQLQHSEEAPHTASGDAISRLVP